MVVTVPLDPRAPPARSTWPSASVPKARCCSLPGNAATGTVPHESSVASGSTTGQPSRPATPVITAALGAASRRATCSNPPRKQTGEPPLVPLAPTHFGWPKRHSSGIHNDSSRYSQEAVQAAVIASASGWDAYTTGAPLSPSIASRMVGRKIALGGTSPLSSRKNQSASTMRPKFCRLNAGRPSSRRCSSSETAFSLTARFGASDSASGSSRSSSTSTSLIRSGGSSGDRPSRAGET